MPSSNQTPQIFSNNKPYANALAQLPQSLMPQVALNQPLVLDLDGTLVRSDHLFECFTVALRRQPVTAVLCVWWLLRYGIAYVKMRLAENTIPDPDFIPVNEQVKALAENEKLAGREIILATAANEALARPIAQRFPFISKVHASTQTVNLKGSAKRDLLTAEYPQGFIYAGDAAPDLAIWQKASGAILVETSPSLTQRVKKLNIPMVSISPAKPYIRVLARALRLHQWAKNALVFAPVILASRYNDPNAWLLATIAFIAMGLVASATYLINDLSDIGDDRRHWSKRLRPLAAGTLPIKSAFMIVPTFMLAGFLLAALINWQSLAVLLIYAVMTLSYSLALKRVPILDTLMLACMFSLRLLLGSVAITALISPWSFVFSMALFLSISMAKRHTEVLRMTKMGLTEVAGRGYRASDNSLLLALGSSTAISAIVFLCLYLMAETAKLNVYQSPVFLWLTPVAIFLWLGRIWLLSERGDLDDDPVAFAVRDKISLTLGLVVVFSFILAKIIPASLFS